ncbi:hypothetical protein EC844_10844 [Acinetobacter calcoaceticus]|uniref:Lipoprotein n=1 Tax=Acinetobacter calcoaceticus TaxID=471 RepID=A0A4R1XY16_ACICA|nr:hypothetical protein EC844_10844 [Acinetobacter calcoaceticus]
MKKQLTIAMLSTTLLISGCTSTGGFATASNGGCDTQRTAAVGAIVGAVAGFALSHGNANSSAQNNRAMALGSLAGGALSAGLCVMINANTVQKKSAAEVETAYKKSNKGVLPEYARVEQYSTVVLPNQTVQAQQNIIVKSDLTVIEGRSEPLSRVQEKLILKDPNGKVIRELVKDVQTSGSSEYGSGGFENSFTWKFPANVSKGRYVLDTEVLVNGQKVAHNSRVINLT